MSLDPFDSSLPTFWIRIRESYVRIAGSLSNFFLLSYALFELFGSNRQSRGYFLLTGLSLYFARPSSVSINFWIFGSLDFLLSFDFDLVYSNVKMF